MCSRSRSRRTSFEGYERLAPFDWEGYTTRYGDIQRLDRILEAENDTPNRYQVSKQADVLMLLYLFSADELALLFEQLGYPFDRDAIPRNLDYYMARTSHGSTLSRIANSWVLARSDRPRSWHLFQLALDSDLADIQGGTTPEGIRYRRQVLHVEVNHDWLHIASRAFPAASVTIAYRGRFREVAPGDTYEFRLIRPEERNRDENRTARSQKILS